ncbi:MAG: SLC13 family permease [Marinobacter sp.]|uniref:SLC13 family permease n=1 Tax=Marinobacter sp. TaxID=50741 RepID=UPI00299F3852|nr:SLC13 family permease [Marinobacter sp.]MDX1635803.1 SLC13 family permease [Marinobacter sp.]
MTVDQGIVFAVLAATLAMFIWGRLRFDVVAMLALLVVAVIGLVPPDEVFAGFGHPAVVTVAGVLVVSQGLVNAGVVDSIARFIGRVGTHPMIQVVTLTGVVALCSGFMNNTGALALLMPVAVWLSRKGGHSPSLLLMPLAFGSLLGGTMTLIGTPPNIIISSYREETGAEAFGLFDYLPVGLAIALVGTAFIALLGWRLTPQRKEPSDEEELFPVGDYITEVQVPEKSSSVGNTLHSLLEKVEEDADVVVLGLIRDDRRELAPSTYKVLRPGDILLVEADTDSLQYLLDVANLSLPDGVGEEGEVEEDELEDEKGGRKKRRRDNGDVNLLEVIVSADSPLIGQTANRLSLRVRYGINVVAVARQGQRIKKRIANIRFNAGDILLVQGRQDTLHESLSDLGCLPLAERGLRIGSPRRTLLAAGIFIVAIGALMLGVVQAATALVGAAVAMVVVGLLNPSEAYRSIDWSVIVLLGAMIPVGEALETTGGANLIADQMMAIGGTLAPAPLLIMLMVVTMLLSNVVNNAAAAILLAPIAISLSQQLAMSADALLMTVAIGASCAFLTPIGHQSNALVMEPGGYRFGDYWRLGLPLSALVVATAVPMILWVWN